MDAFIANWAEWWDYPPADVSPSDLATAHALLVSGLTIGVSVDRHSLLSKPDLRGNGQSAGASHPISALAFHDAATWSAVIPSLDRVADLLLAAHESAWAGQLTRAEGDIWWKDGEIQFSASHPSNRFTSAWEGGRRLSTPPRTGLEFVAATIGASTFVSQFSSPLRLGPQPTTFHAEKLAPLLSSSSLEKWLFGECFGDVQAVGSRVIQQRVTRRPDDGAMFHLIDSRQGNEALLFASRYRPEMGYVSDGAVTWQAHLDADGRIVGIGHWAVQHRSGFVSVEDGQTRRELPTRIVFAAGGSAAPPSGRSRHRNRFSPDLIDVTFITEWVLRYRRFAMPDSDAELELAVEEHLKRQWEALEAFHDSEEYRQMSSEPMPESVRRRREFPQLITDQRFCQEGVATHVFYRWSRPLPSDDVIQKAAHTPGQSYLDPADQPPSPPGAPGGPPAPGSSSPTIARHARWTWWTWWIAGGALLLVALLRLLRGRRPAGA